MKHCGRACTPRPAKDGKVANAKNRQTASSALRKRSKKLRYTLTECLL
ncbi:Uncharacterized protein dnm_046990 [Desulfonema magnum]|uniref:Uncharacterized protein n=1 Tax=Desulfonema magnum TaxID=45655 RepID=A0A975BNR8_9BACT|nr:Uncharacterized protein dnm_046990 [Desulfonema magnum]